MTFGGFLYWRALVPTHEGDWQLLQERLPEASLHQTEDADVYIKLRGIRDFRYGEDGSIAETRYLENVYYPQDVNRVWLGLSHFAEPGMAHAFLSFEFPQGNLVVSIEARLRPDQSYNPLLGLVRQYPRMLVWGTEADIIGLRTHARGERVLLYPLKLTPEQAQGLLVALAMETANLAQTPEFYNTLTDNCATGLLKFEPNYRWYTSLIDYRVLLPGYIDGLLLERGWIDGEEPLEVLRQKAEARVVALDPASDYFSVALRRGWQD